jgi:hypothetical protein
MVPDLSRRGALRASSALAALGLLARCGVVATRTTNGVTTVTINVAKVNAYAQAGSNFAAAILSEPLIATFIAPYAAVITAAQTLIMTDLTAFDAAAGGSVTLTFNAASIPLFISSVLTDMETLLGDVMKALPASAIVGTVEANIEALSALISLFEAMIGVMPAAAKPGAAPPMSETDALKVLKVR